MEEIFLLARLIKQTLCLRVWKYGPRLNSGMLTWFLFHPQTSFLFSSLHPNGLSSSCCQSSRTNILYWTDSKTESPLVNVSVEGHKAGLTEHQLGEIQLFQYRKGQPNKSDKLHRDLKSALKDSSPHVAPFRAQRIILLLYYAQQLYHLSILTFLLLVNWLIAKTYKKTSIISLHLVKYPMKSEYI